MCRRHRGAAHAGRARGSRHRLARREALRVRARRRRDAARRDAFALRRRPQPRPDRRGALPRRRQHRALPDAHVRRRADLRRGARAGCRRGRRRGAPSISSRITRCSPRRSSACARATATRSCSTAIRSAAEVPRFFAGRLPDLNLGTADGASCAPRGAGRRRRSCSPAPRLHERRERPLQGRLRHAPLRAPARGVHALQLETAQACYMDEAPPYRGTRRARRR